MLSFEERMKLLNNALEEHTQESLLKELQKTPPYGASLAEYTYLANLDKLPNVSNVCADVKATQHARYDEICKEVIEGSLDYKPAHKSVYSASANKKFTVEDYNMYEHLPEDHKDCADGFKLGVVEEYLVHNRKDPIQILGTTLDNPDCPVCISLDQDWEGITLSQGAGWMDNEGDMVYIQGVENLTKLRDMLNHMLKGK